MLFQENNRPVKSSWRPQKAFLPLYFILMMTLGKKENTGSHVLILPFDINDKNIYSITSYNNKTVTAAYFLFDDDNAYFVENRGITKHWNVSKIFYDSNGGEIVTSEGDIIYLTKEILIKKASGEEIALEYIPVEINEIKIWVKAS